MFVYKENISPLHTLIGHKITNEDILQLVELDEIVNRFQQGKYDSKP